MLDYPKIIRVVKSRDPVPLTTVFVYIGFPTLNLLNTLQLQIWWFFFLDCGDTHVLCWGVVLEIWVSWLPQPTPPTCTVKKFS